MSKNNGGPAFPAPYGVSHVTTEGMTLRDYFAAKAMQGFCVSTVDDSPIAGWNFNYFAEYAYKAADAMLAEREKNG